ncbi:MAG: hypothetical protein OIF35_05005 [Cellvibrionaceae bacterium]|nr:hypothetical protein [Cellvibrionaceae bacterium]MCV6624845.1 hypothetical protein [Cellvibrionaceae bacterium]
MFVYNLHICAEDEFSYEDQIFRNPVFVGEQIMLDGEYFLIDAITHDADNGVSWAYLQPLEDEPKLA